MHRTPYRTLYAALFLALTLLGPTLPGTLHAMQEGAMLHDPKANFEGYRTFAFAQDPEEELASGSEQGGSPFVERQIQREIRYELARRGYDQAGLGEADFLIAINVGARTTTWYSVQQTVYRDPYETYFTQWGAVRGIELRTFQDGTISIDMIDGQSNKLVWHGWATEPIAPSKTTEEIIKGIVKKVLDNFPPGSKSS